jgi:hypothetical protein
MPRARKTGVEDLPSTGYGDEAALLESVAQVPMVGADEVPNLSDQTNRPAEPVTSGLPIGPGPGPEALGGVTANDPVRAALQAMLVAFPNNDIQRLIDRLDIAGR